MLVKYVDVVLERCGRLLCKCTICGGAYKTLQTQTFQSFIDARIQPDADDGGFIAFFDEAVEAKKNNSRFTLTRRTPGPKPKVTISS